MTEERKSVKVKPLFLNSAQHLSKILAPLRIVGNSPPLNTQPLQRIDRRNSSLNKNNYNTGGNSLNKTFNSPNSAASGIKRINYIKPTGSFIGKERRDTQTSNSCSRLFKSSIQERNRNQPPVLSKRTQKQVISRGTSNQREQNFISPPPKIAVPNFPNRSLASSGIKSPQIMLFGRNCRSTLRFNQFTHPLLSTSRERIPMPHREVERERGSLNPERRRISSNVGSNKKVRFKDDFDCNVQDDDATVFQDRPSERFFKVNGNGKRINFDLINKFNSGERSNPGSLNGSGYVSRFVGR